jgi:hypothetical protein
MDQRLSDVKVWCLKHVTRLSDDPCAEREDGGKEGSPHAKSTANGKQAQYDTRTGMLHTWM